MTTTTSLPVAAPAVPPEPPVRRAVIPYHLKRAAMVNAWAARATNSGVTAAMLFASGPDGQTWRELFDMQRAIWGQLHRQGQDWHQGLADWGQEWVELKAANTMSKLVEQEFNLIAQFGQLMSQQATDFVTLMESVQVGFGYWVSQKLER